MLPGAPQEAQWIRSAPRLDWPAPVLQRMVQTAFPRSRISQKQLLAAGLRNANFKLTLDSSSEPVVLRIYEHDPSLCRKEIDLMRLVRHTVPVPEVIHAEPRGLEELPPFALLQFIQGASLLDLKRRSDFEAFAQASSSAGETLAAIGRFPFSRTGWLGPGPAVAAPLLAGADPVPNFIDLCLAAPNLVRRVPAELRRRIHQSIWHSSHRFVELDAGPRLVHGDFSRRNLLARQAAGRWSVVEFWIGSLPSRVRRSSTSPTFCATRRPRVPWQSRIFPPDIFDPAARSPAIGGASAVCSTLPQPVKASRAAIYPKTSRQS